MECKTGEELLAFIRKSPSCYHVIETICRQLKAHGFISLQEGEEWKLAQGGSYFVTRNRSSLLAFRIPQCPLKGFQVMASHGDSPTFRVKANPEITVEKRYVKLNVEKYGGMIDSSWLDRPLSVAGRLVIREGERLCTKLVDVDRDLVLIPNLAIHMNREVNKGQAYHPQIDLLPLFGMEESFGAFESTLAQAAGVERESILGMDLFLYNRTPGTIWGANREFVSSGRLDDLQCVYASMRGFLEAEPHSCVPVLCVLDNEEVGSATKQGAGSTFLKSTLRRVCAAFDTRDGAYEKALANSFMLSADNAHGLHPNRTEKADPTNRPCLNRGIVLKYNGNQKYATDAVSEAVFQMFCEKAKVPWQTYTNRSELPGGSTLGNIANTQTAMNTADIGLAQLAMHSAYETAGVLDTEYLRKLAKSFFSSGVLCEADGTYRIAE